MGNDTADGAKVYTPFTLKLYDWWVLEVSNRNAWRCSTRKTLLPYFQKYLGRKHLDIGVGTGYYLEKSKLDSQKITLLDLNANSLDAAKKRIGQDKIDACVQHDIFKPLPAKLIGSFDSVSLFYLLHCLPGNMADKSTAIKNIASALKESGIAYGATVLGQDVKHNGFGRKLVSIYNKKGIFNNQQDSRAALQNALEQCFDQVEITIHGTVALFAAQKPKRYQKIFDDHLR